MSITTKSSSVGCNFQRRAGFWLKFIGLSGVMLVALGASVGIGQSPSQRPNDDVLQLRIQSAIDNDPELKPRRLAVLVNVVDRVVVLGGPVPDADVIARLETVARAVPGVASVKVSVWVPSSLTPSDPLGRKVAELMKPPPAETSAEPPLLSLPPVARPVAEPPPAKPPTPTPVRLPAPPSTDPRPLGSSTSKRGPDGLLLDPVAPTGTGFRPAPRAPGASALPYETIPPPNVPALPPRADAQPEPTPDFAPVDPPPAPKALSALDELRRDPRFTGLKLEIDGGVAVISGRAAGGSERVWALAQAVRRLPGVERVVVRQ